MPMLKRTEVKYGLIFSLVSFIWLCLEFFLGFHGSHIEKHVLVSKFFSFPAVIIMVQNIMQKKKELGGKITFGQAFQSGFIMTLIVALLSPGVYYLFFTIVNPGYFEAFRNYAIEMKLATADEAASDFNLKAFLVQGAISAIVMGVLSTAIIGFFARTKK
jgi:hypothetical protein